MPVSFVFCAESKLAKLDKPTLPLSSVVLFITVDPFLIRNESLLVSICRLSFFTSSSPKALLLLSFKLVPAFAPTVAPASIPESFVPVPDSKESRFDKPTFPLSKACVSITVDPFLILNVVSVSYTHLRAHET